MDTKNQSGGTLDANAYEEHRSLISQIIANVARDEHLNADVASEFASVVWEQLLASNPMAQFQGRCSVKTFLTVVIRNAYRDFRNKRWGKWRHSAEARRLGPVALQLETLLVRDGYSFDQAVGILHTNCGVTMGRDELYAISIRLPHRPRRFMVGEEALDGVAVSSDDIERGAERDRIAALAERVRTTLRQTLDGLTAQDRLIMRMLFEEGLTVAQVAGVLKLEQKPLYRHRDLLFQKMRRRLEVEGITASDVNELWQRDGGQHE